MAADEKTLAEGLDQLIKSRDWKKDPPNDKETMQELGAGPGQLDGPIRAWINATFRKPNGWPLFISGDLTTDMTWEDFKKKVLTKPAKATIKKAEKSPKPKKPKSPKPQKDGDKGDKQ